MLILFSDSHTVLRCLPCALPCSVIVNGNQFLMDGSQVDLGTTLKKAVIIGNVITVSQCFSLCDRKLNLTGKSLTTGDVIRTCAYIICPPFREQQE